MTHYSAGKYVIEIFHQSSEPSVTGVQKNGLQLNCLEGALSVVYHLN